MQGDNIEHNGKHFSCFTKSCSNVYELRKGVHFTSFPQDKALLNSRVLGLPWWFNG